MKTILKLTEHKKNGDGYTIACAEDSTGAIDFLREKMRAEFDHLTAFDRRRVEGYDVEVYEVTAEDWQRCGDIDKAISEDVADIVDTYDIGTVISGALWELSPVSM